MENWNYEWDPGDYEWDQDDREQDLFGNDWELFDEDWEYDRRRDEDLYYDYDANTD